MRGGSLERKAKGLCYIFMAAHTSLAVWMNIDIKYRDMLENWKPEC